MLYAPQKDYELPNYDILTCLFESPESDSNEDTILFAEAAHPEHSFTKAQVRTYTKQLAYIFRHQFGIGKNGPNKDVVVTISSGHVLVPMVCYGVIAAGGVYSAASTAFKPQELVRQIQQGQSNLVICSPDCKDVAQEAARQCGIPMDRVLVSDGAEKQISLKAVADGRNLMEGQARKDEMLDWKRITDPEELKKSKVCLMYSSGTTGVPKGVILSHTNLVAECLLWHFARRDFVTLRCQQDPSFTFEYRSVGHLPVAHVTGLMLYLIISPMSGGPTYWMPKFDFPQFLEYSKKYAMTFVVTVPPIYLAIAKSPLVTDQFHSLRHATTGAAPMGPELATLASNRLGVSIAQTWGLSETTGSVTLLPWHEHDSTGSVSRVAPNTRLRIVDDSNKDVPDGERGELIVQGPTVVQGYHLNEQANKEAFTSDGWFKTGDVGYHKNGLFYIVDRKKELIKYKGMQVAPAELEALLLSNDLIQDAAVIGIPDPDADGNELPRAYVVADRKKISAEEVKEFVKGNLSHYKQLRNGVVFVKEIPKSASGKILRRELRELAKGDKDRRRLKIMSWLEGAEGKAKL